MEYEDDIKTILYIFYVVIKQNFAVLNAQDFSKS